MGREKGSSTRPGGAGGVWEPVEMLLEMVPGELQHSDLGLGQSAGAHESVAGGTAACT